MGENFKRQKEDFDCEHCGEKVIGNGYTNHCPRCLWSRHVDVNPGDRAEKCDGLLRPERVVWEAGEYVIEHQCERCGLNRRVRATAADDISSFLAAC